MTHAEQAEQHFEAGCNCCQAVFLAFQDLHQLPVDVSLKLTSGMGGGIARMRVVCGAFTGMVLAAGILKGPEDPCQAEQKAEHYAFIQSLAKEFEAFSGSLLCRDLLKLQETHSIPIPDNRDAQYYQERPCAALVYQAAAILEQHL